MTISAKLLLYLEKCDASYEVVHHVPTRSALQNALVCQLPPHQLAKAVLLDTPHDHLLAVLPSDRRLALDELGGAVGQALRISDERQLAFIFDDCATGAVPPLGFEYGVPTIVDDSLDRQPDVYFEGGDHVSLIHMDQAEFARVTQGARHGRFSERWSERS